MTLILWLIIGCLMNYLLTYHSIITGKSKQIMEFKIAIQAFIIECIVGIVAFYVLRFAGNSFNEFGTFTIGATAIETMRRILEKSKALDKAIDDDLNL